MNNVTVKRLLILMLFCFPLLYYEVQDKIRIYDLKSLLNSSTLKRYKIGNEKSNETLIPSGAIGNATSNMIMGEAADCTFITVLCCSKTKNWLSDTKVQSKVKQLTVLLKSAALITKRKLRFYIVSNIDVNELQTHISDITESWPEKYKSRLLLSYHETAYPPGTERFQRMGQPCVTMRLFFPDMFPELDAAVYIDMDIIFLRRPEELWDQFQKFDDFQLAAVGDATLYRKHHKTIPYYGGGINPGIMMMNMTRMRRLSTSIPVEGLWTSAMLAIEKSYGSRVRQDMDILNVFFKLNPRLLLLLDCWWTFIKSYCEADVPCIPLMESENRGIALLHGAGGQFDKEGSQRQFKAVYDAFETYSFDSPLDILFKELKTKLVDSEKEKSKYCSKTQNISGLIILELDRYI